MHVNNNNKKNDVRLNVKFNCFLYLVKAPVVKSPTAIIMVTYLRWDLILVGNIGWRIGFRGCKMVGITYPAFNILGAVTGGIFLWKHWDFQHHQDILEQSLGWVPGNHVSEHAQSFTRSVTLLLTIMLCCEQ
jgi:hypothetical protein